MKRLIGNIAVLLTGLGFCACGPDTDLSDAEHYIDVLTESAFEVGYEETILTVEIDANCKWNIRKTDMAGAAISWLKTDMADGEGPETFRIKVLRNNTSVSRMGTVNIYSDQTQMFIDVTQAANPDPDAEPEIFKGYNMPVYQMFESGIGIDVAGGAVKKMECDFTNATVEGNVVTFANGLVIEKAGQTPAEIMMLCPSHTNPATHAGFQLGISAKFAEGESWIYKIPLNFELYGDLRFTYGSRKEGIETTTPYKWSSDNGVTWNEITKMEPLKSDAAFKSIWFTIPQAQKVPREGQLWIKVDQTQSEVFIQNGIVLEKASAKQSSLASADASKVVISEGFDSTVEANASYLAVPGVMKSLVSGYTKSDGVDVNPYVPTDDAITVSHCFARPGFLQVGYSDEALKVRCGWNGEVIINVGERLAEMGVTEPVGLRVSFSAATMTNAFGNRTDAAIVLKVDDKVVNALDDISVNRFDTYSLIVPQVDQNSVLTITSRESSSKTGEGKAASSYESADYRFFIDDLLIETTAVSNQLMLSFDMTSSEVMKDWPTTKTPQPTAATPHQTVAYCDGAAYDFLLSNPSEATNNSLPYFNGTKLFFPKYRFMGLPAIPGYKLVKVKVTDASSAVSDKRGFGITTKIAKQSSTGNNGQEFVSGGEHQSVTGNGPYTFELSGTQANTMYYLRVASQDALISEIELTYEK